ncbi:hypothetical protein J2Z48_000802 [Croceifilum oryzae]|uniref:Uncharacterized protein n=1 Tax=Croceifilum oryzae TaxID=1553429 RepID=A0AAJ1WRJ0_9BACL|nr:hypothetical protein [Croceifilum oryzae]MDQ0416635.1 hypothetical protein [Croceifilum oryzae]
MFKSLNRVTVASLLIFVAIPMMTFAHSYTSTLTSTHSYTSTLTLDYQVNGAVRNYLGTDLTIQTYGNSVKCTTAKQPENDYFFVDLYRFSDWGPDDFVGRIKQSRQIEGKNTFSNVGAGKYYFSFQKADDSCTVRANIKYN